LLSNRENSKRDDLEDDSEDRRKNGLVDLSNRQWHQPEKTDLEEDLLGMIYAIILISLLYVTFHIRPFLWEYIADI